MWYKLVRSYKDLNSAKFKVIHEMGAKLPSSLYDSEWNKVNWNSAKWGKKEKKRKYIPFTKIEKIIPFIFFLIHMFVFVRGVFN